MADPDATTPVGGAPAADGVGPGGVVDDAPLGRAFWTLVASSGLSNLADGIFKIALPLLAIRYTRSPSLVAGVAIAGSLPWLLFALQAGAYADRWDRRRTMLVANTVRGLAVTVPAAAALVGGGSLWWLYVAAAIAGTAEVFHDTAAQSILPSIVPRRSLPRANGRLYAVELGSQQFVAPPLGGLLVGAAAAAALWAPALLWGVAVLALWTVRGSYRATRPGTVEPTNIRQDVVEGLRFLAGHRMLRVLAALTGAMNLLGAAAGPLLVLFAVGEESALGLDEAGFGLLSITMAVGALVGSFVAERMIAVFGRAATFAVTIVLSALMLLGPALTTSVPVIAVLMFAGGFGMMVWNIPAVSFRQTVTPDHMLGRINSAYRLVAWGTMPLGAAIGGGLAELLPLQAVFGLLGGVSLLLVLPNRVITDDRLAEAERRADAAREALADEEAGDGRTAAASADTPSPGAPPVDP